MRKAGYLALMVTALSVVARTVPSAHVSFWAVYALALTALTVAIVIWDAVVRDAPVARGAGLRASQIIGVDTIRDDEDPTGPVLR